MFLFVYDEIGFVDFVKSDNGEVSDFYLKYMYIYLQVLKYLVYLLIYIVLKKFYKCNIYIKRIINYFKFKMIMLILRLLKIYDKIIY